MLSRERLVYNLHQIGVSVCVYDVRTPYTVEIKMISRERCVVKEKNLSLSYSRLWRGPHVVEALRASFLA